MCLCQFANSSRRSKRKAEVDVEYVSVMRSGWGARLLHPQFAQSGSPPVPPPPPPYPTLICYHQRRPMQAQEPPVMIYWRRPLLQQCPLFCARFAGLSCVIMTCSCVYLCKCICIDDIVAGIVNTYVDRCDFIGI